MAETYKHGAYARLGDSELTVPNEASSVVVALVTAPVNLSKDPQVDTPVKISSKKDAIEFGYSTGEDFTSNKMIDAALDINEIAPIYLINVLDPEKHKGESKTAELQFIKNAAMLSDDKAIFNSLVLEDRTAGTDYNVTVDGDGSVFFVLREPVQAGGTQPVTLRPQNADIHEKSGVTFADNELRFEEGKEIDPSLLHEDTYYAALNFPKPEGAVSVDVSLDGKPFHTGVNLTQENSDEDSVFDGVYHIYIGFADKDGKRIGMRSYDFKFVWTLADGSTVKTDAVINRMPANELINGNGTLSVSYETVDPSQVTKKDLIGTAEDGVFTGLQSINLLIQKYGLTPSNISLYCPVYGEDPEIYQALLNVSPLNGHYLCFTYTDIPLDKMTFKQVIEWKQDNQDDEFSATHWPYTIAKDKKVYPTGMIAITGQLALDAANGDIPYMTISNKDLPIIGQYFGEGSKVQGFDQHTGNQLNEQGIITNVFYGGRQTIWGSETANVKDGEADDPRAQYITAIRMQMYLVNDFQNRFAKKIDQPLSQALIGEIISEESIFLDDLASKGAIYGVEFGFHETKNSTETAMKGYFYFKMADSPAIPVTYIDSEVAYTDRWYGGFLGEE